MNATSRSLITGDSSTSHRFPSGITASHWLFSATPSIAAHWLLSSRSSSATVAQVKAAVAKWNGANRLIRQSTGLTESLKVQVAQLERLFEANQTDLTKLLQARQRLIQARECRARRPLAGHAGPG